MKKKNLRGLKLNKEYMSNLNDLNGGAEKSQRRTNCELCIKPPTQAGTSCNTCGDSCGDFTCWETCHWCNR
ncbi:hypothetical protein H2O64_23805 [Kordia sp. YSTF-M3]|uniref:Natural product n=1 Tax=Kordia aestuariivivens TaxID=2759037 RepID=A0ABR7QGT8_9FLAO|nr:hypothetical protein [Kordia aestuariivivens]MBC8757713.1 hypothetical protein [Kordia aestuariivivens]